MRLLVLTAATALGLAGFMGDPARVSFAPPPAEAAQLICSSANFTYARCPADVRRGASLARQLSRAPCIAGRSWGTDRGAIWVDRGCSGAFTTNVYRRGVNGGDIAAAAILGGIVGAVLSSSSDNHSHDAYVHHSYSRDDIPEPAWVTARRARDIQSQRDQERQRRDYQANQQYQRDLQAGQDREQTQSARDRADREANARQRAEYQANQEHQAAIQKAQDRDNARSEAAAAREAEAQANIRAGEQDENRQAAEAQAAAAHEAATQANIHAGEQDELRQAAEAEAHTSEETPNR